MTNNDDQDAAQRGRTWLLASNLVAQADGRILFAAADVDEAIKAIAVLDDLAARLAAVEGELNGSYRGRDGEPVTLKEKLVQVEEFADAMDRLAVENNRALKAAEADWDRYKMALEAIIAGGWAGDLALEWAKRIAVDALNSTGQEQTK